MIVRWDLAKDTASFDFYSWLVMAAAKGATGVVFGIDNILKTGTWPESVIRKRFHSIIEPGPALLGMPYSFGVGGEWPHGPRMDELVQFYRGGGTFPWLRTVRTQRQVRFTVTLRRNAHNPQRNSNKDAWFQFADEIGAFVMEDYDFAPIHLHERMALYAGAEMNFGVVTGPMHLCNLANYPFMMFKANTEVKTFEFCGIPRGTNYPWSKRPDQFLVWEDDDLPSIKRHFAAWHRVQETNRNCCEV